MNVTEKDRTKARLIVETRWSGIGCEEHNHEAIIEAFASALARAREEEREACAALADEHAQEMADCASEYPEHSTQWRQFIDRACEASCVSGGIRARHQEKPHGE